MGVKDLLQWVKKNYPEAIVTYPQRWGDPNMLGKRIAIDGTLQTNRYHFASRNGQFGDKGPLIGWYNLINEMRANGCKPIGIWDERGVREWKAPEARRRLTIRAGNLARQAHEIERSARLSSLRETFKDFQEMNEEEKDLVRRSWEATRFVFPKSEGKDRKPLGREVKSKISRELERQDHELPTPQSTPAPTSPLPLLSPTASPSSPSLPSAKTEGTGQPPLPSSSTESKPSEQPSPGMSPESYHRIGILSTLKDATIQTFERVTSMIDSLSHLIQDYRNHSPPVLPSSSPSSSTSDIGLGLEHFHQELEEQIASRVNDKGKEEREEYIKQLDETLAQLLPPEKFSETRRQAELTREEGEIINSFLTPQVPSPSQIVKVDPIYPTPSSSPSSTPMPMETEALITVEKRIVEPDPMGRLNELTELSAPTIQAMYDNALDIPSHADHEDCKALLRLMGVPVIEAKIPYEAEGLASALAKKGLVDYVGTEDSDVLAYGGPLLRSLSPISSPLSVISGPRLRELLELGASEYLDFVILLGTDASPRIPKVGPVNALKLIRKHHSIETMLTFEPGIKERIRDGDIDGFMEMVRNARKVFTDLPEVDEWDSKLEEGQWDEREVERWLEDNHGIKLVDNVQQAREEDQWQ